MKKFGSRYELTKMLWNQEKLSWENFFITLVNKQSDQDINEIFKSKNNSDKRFNEQLHVIKNRKVSHMWHNFLSNSNHRCIVNNIYKYKTKEDENNVMKFISNYFITKDIRQYPFISLKKRAMLITNGDKFLLEIIIESLKKTKYKQMDISKCWNAEEIFQFINYEDIKYYVIGNIYKLDFLGLVLSKISLDFYNTLSHPNMNLVYALENANRQYHIIDPTFLYINKDNYYQLFRRYRQRILK